ncbi:MAG: hypothetical protein HYY06_06335 [Deltaproteobacteria bacterium]|nr:hypothetical protein [Deltaproteobacteria bacterium]
MSWRTRLLPWSLAAATVGLAGCMGGDHGDAERVYQAMTARDDAHHDAATSADDAMRLRAETDGYAADIAGLLDDMRSACSDMMGSGMMGGTDDDRFEAMTDQMGTAVDDHHARLTSMTDVDDMRHECDSHHAAMGGMLDEMQDMMVDGGMM